MEQLNDSTLKSKPNNISYNRKSDLKLKRISKNSNHNTRNKNNITYNVTWPSRYCRQIQWKVKINGFFLCLLCRSFKYNNESSVN